MFDLQRLRALVVTVDGFYVRDRALARQQKKMKEILAARSPADAEARTYVDAVRKYFEGFEREARAHLKHVDRELEKLYQVQFNLTAERGVAQRRVEATQGVLSTIAELGG
ncbi:MAG TPA: hypothetical protein VN603_10960 [Candidatus Acidoferrales bacterium]|nr:hypothetical protein [Candidatus Acidoferrales bacterium]